MHSLIFLQMQKELEDHSTIEREKLKASIQDSQMSKKMNPFRDLTASL
jgi:hypothetical protein